MEEVAVAEAEEAPEAAVVVALAAAEEEVLAAVDIQVVQVQAALIVLTAEHPEVMDITDMVPTGVHQEPVVRL